MSRDDTEQLLNNLLLACQLCLGLWQFSRLTPVGALIQGAVGWLLRPLRLSPTYSALQPCEGRVFKRANCFALQADISSDRRGIVSPEVNTMNLHYLGRDFLLERKEDDDNILFVNQKICYYITHRIWKELQNLEQALRYGLEGPPLARAAVTRAVANRAEADAGRAEADAERAKAVAEQAENEARTAQADAKRAEAMARRAAAEAKSAEAETEAERAEAEAESMARCAEAEAESAEAEAEAERARAEAERARAEAERAMAAEAERARAAVARYEAMGRARAAMARDEAMGWRSRLFTPPADARAEDARDEAMGWRPRLFTPRADARAEDARVNALKVANAAAKAAEIKVANAAAKLVKAKAKHATRAAAKAEFAGYKTQAAKIEIDGSIPRTAVRDAARSANGAVAEAARAADEAARAADEAVDKAAAARARIPAAADKAAAALARIPALTAAAAAARAAASAAHSAAAAADSAVNKAAAARARIPALTAAAADARATASAAQSAAAARSATDAAGTTLFVKGKREFWKEVITGGVMTFKEVLDAIILYNQHVSVRLSNDWLLPVNLSVSEEKLLKIFNLVALFLQTKKANVHWLIPTSLSFISALLEFNTSLRVWFYSKINELFCNIMHFICDRLPRSWRREVYSLGKWVENLAPSNDILVKVVRGKMCAIISEGAEVNKEGAILVPWLETESDFTPDFGVVERQFRCHPIDIIIRCCYVVEHELCEISARPICVFYVKCKSIDDFRRIVTLVSCVADKCCGSLISYGPNNKVCLRGFEESVTSYVNNGLPPIYILELENVVVAGKDASD